MDCSPPGPSVHGIFQARVLEWGAIVLWGGNKKRFLCSQAYWQCSFLPRPLIDIVTWYIIPFFYLNAGSRLFFSAPKVTSRQNSLDKIRYKAQRTCYIHFSFSCCKLCPEEYHAILKDSTYQFLILMDERSTVTWKMVKKNYSWDMWYGSKDKTSPSS